MSIGALSGFTVAVTADRRSEEQAELLVRRGATVLHAPVIRTLPLSDESALRSATEDIIAAPPDIVVLCTSLGVRGWCSAADGLGLGAELTEVLCGAEVIARGSKAVGAALALEVPVDWAAPGATYREVVEHLGARRSRRPDGTAVRVAVQLDGKDSSGMVDSLEELGYDVVGVRVYRWTLPEDLDPAERLVATVADGTVDAVTFTSAHAVENFVELARRCGEWDRVLQRAQGSVVICCVGPVTGGTARAAGMRAAIEPTSPRLGAMVQALSSAFAQRSTTLQLNRLPVHVQGRLVAVGGAAPVRLTDRERAVFDALVRHPGAVVSKRALVDRVWAGAVDEHVVEVTVARLRKRLGAAGASIATVLRRGYRLDVDPWETPR
mgnify:CR=1 FL=1